MSGRVGDGDGFGDEGHFIVDEGAQRNPHALNWPTVLASAGVAAVVASLILSIGIVGMHRDDSAAAAQPAVVRVVADPGTGIQADGAAGAGVEAADPPASGAPPVDGGPAPIPGATAAAPATGTGAAGVSPAPPAPADAQAPPAAAPQEQSTETPQGHAAEPQDPAEPTAWAPSSPLPPDFAVSAAEPTLADLNNLVYFITATAASDEAKARNIEAGMGGVIVPKTVYNLGLFRAPRGWSRVTGPVQRQGDRITVQLHSLSAGMPGVDMPIEFVRQGGVWKLASSSLCAGVRTVGLPVYCNG
ncbi:hypothetical protein [Tomitella fengzijianii]|uniref:Low molecular weight antigen MTB12-like C-terminal domain-containing protein n=1 Tax=Tomitella fengzijianii TaxID=2597660 RepID=A0A516X0B7_9ACTN|nr:hypothetical protein [Tomitella fengzijianii]QDQ96470.1 hypothetical protein FO059_02825 [Tomitella fengzijianii]